MTKGPDLETKNFYGFTPLSLAMDLKHYDVALVEYLQLNKYSYLYCIQLILGVVNLGIG